MSSIQSVGVARTEDSLTRMVYAVLLLLLTTALYVAIAFRVDGHLLQIGQISLFRTIHEYSDLMESLFYAIQLVVVLWLFRPIGRIFVRQQVEISVVNHLQRDAAWGFIGGLATLLGAAPGLMLDGKSSTLGSFLDNHIYSAGGLTLLLFLAILLPVASEGFFRGVLLRRLLTNMSAPAAVIVTTLVFALCSPTFHPVASIAVGIGTGIVYYRTRSIPACIITNSTFSVLAVAVLMWRSLSA